MDNNETFERLYNQLEDLLRKKYRLDSTASGVYYHEFRVGEQQGKNLRVMRELRNHLVHSRRPDAIDACVVTDQALKFMTAMIDSIERPKRAIDVCIQKEKILFGTLSSLAIPMMKIMLERGISHVPVMNSEGKIIGVFSGVTLISEIVALQEIMIDTKTILNDFVQYLPVHAHTGERYVFIAKTASLDEIIALFGEKPFHGKKLRMIFVTEHGLEEERILGLITPWDILDDNVVAA